MYLDHDDDDDDDDDDFFFFFFFLFILRVLSGHFFFKRHLDPQELPDHAGAAAPKLGATGGGWALLTKKNELPSFSNFLRNFIMF